MLSWLISSCTLTVRCLCCLFSRLYKVSMKVEFGEWISISGWHNDISWTHEWIKQCLKMLLITVETWTALVAQKPDQLPAWIFSISNSNIFVLLNRTLAELPLFDQLQLLQKTEDYLLWWKCLYLYICKVTDTVIAVKDCRKRYSNIHVTFKVAAVLIWPIKLTRRIHPNNQSELK